MSKSAGIVVLGSTDVTLAVLDALMRNGQTVAGVVSSGPEFKISYSKRAVRNVRAVDVECWCDDHSVEYLPFENYESLIEFLSEFRPLLGLAAGWYHMIPSRVRARFPLGCLGFHASLLPRLRGGAPLNWAILNGDKECGVSLFELTDGVDDGFLFAQRRRPIGDRTMIGELVSWSQGACAEIASNELPLILAGKLTGKRQIGTATYGLQRAPEDGEIDWTVPAIEIDRLVRAVSRPYPGAFTFFDSEKLLIWESEPMAAPHVLGKPGQLFRLPESGTLCVVTGRGLLAIKNATNSEGKDAMAMLGRASQRRLERSAP